MRVGELAKVLKDLDAELEVLCYIEDENMAAEGHPPRVLDILQVSAVDATRSRDEDGVPRLELGKGDDSEKIALLEVTGDF